MTLFTHRAERSARSGISGRLASALAEVLAQPLDDPFATEVVSVPTPGVERWLAQRLSHHLGTTGTGSADGVAAGIAFWSVHRLIEHAVAGVLRLDPETDPWQPVRLGWPVLSELDASADAAWAAPVARYLGNGVGHEHRQGRRWATAHRLALLFHRYGVQRPQLIMSWLAGQDVDAAGQSLPPDRAWQPELWRRVRLRIGLPSGAERLAGACTDLVAHPERCTLPPRLSVFGVNRLSVEQWQVLSSLAQHRDVHLWLPHVSPVLWSEMAEAIGSQGVLGPRRDDPTTAVPHHPLLAYLSRDSRELQQVVAVHAPSAVHRWHPDPDAQAPDPGPTTLLGRLQASLGADRPAQPTALADDDRSLTVHAAHGPDRQVEVLRDQLVGLLAADPTLEPRDIVVMCPDIETFAPLIAADFGLTTNESELLGADHPGHLLRVRLADRSLREVNPLLGIVSRVLDLAQSRVPASAVLDLCSTEPVMAKFHLSDDDLARLTELVTRAGVRWGVDASHRAQFGMSAFGHNTWTMGLDRLLLGVAMDSEQGHYIGTVLPLDDVDAGDVDLVGRFAELLARLCRVLDGLAGRHPLEHWLGTLRDCLDALTAVSTTHRWQSAHAFAALADLADDGAARADVRLGLSDLRALLSDTLRGRPTRANFRTGTLTMCTMLPMRSVPHRVVVLLGVDDGVFPRRGADDGDDLLAADPWVGDHDLRSEDRQLLLDAIMAAQERLIVIYSGADPRTNAERPPAVPIGALLDAVDAAASVPAGRVRDRITIRHRLQPFDPDNFTGPEPSFDRAALAGARALQRPRTPPTSRWLTSSPLPALPTPSTVSLPDLQAFFSHPCRAFLRVRGGLSIFDAGTENDPDEIPIEPGGLQRWAVGDRMLPRRLRGDSRDAVVQAEWRLGAVPPKMLGTVLVDRVAADVDQVVQNAAASLAEPRCNVDLDLALDHGNLTGTLPNVYGTTLVTVGFSRIGARQQLRAWLELLAVTVGHPGEPWRARLFGKGSRTSLGPVSVRYAAAVLDDLLALYGDGLREPIPFAAATSLAYLRALRARATEDECRKEAGNAWRTERDSAYGKFFGSGIDDLVAEPRREDEVRGQAVSPTRFGTLAWRVFRPLLEAVS